jgi:hypothetical protein
VGIFSKKCSESTEWPETIKDGWFSDGEHKQNIKSIMVTTVWQVPSMPTVVPAKLYLLIVEIKKMGDFHPPFH